MKLLQQHMLREHNRHLCNICIKVCSGITFPCPWKMTLSWRKWQRSLTQRTHCLKEGCIHFYVLTVRDRIALLLLVIAAHKESPALYCGRSQAFWYVGQADNVFPLELGNFTRDELKRHEQEHPLCEFCKIRVYSGDDLFEHMRSMHFTCDVCQRNGSFVHFDNADTLVAHLR